MKSSLESYYATLALATPPLRVQQEIDKLEIAVNNAIRANTFVVHHNGSIIGNPSIANSSGDIEMGILNPEQQIFLANLQALGYEVSRDPLTSYWVVSWEQGNSTVPPTAVETRRVLGLEALGTDAPIMWFTTGDAKLTLKIVADDTWIMVDDGTIGNESSGATTRANEDTRDLYVLLYTIFDDTICPVTGGRDGVGEESAGIDFDDGKPLELTKMLGRALAISGEGDGLTPRDHGSIIGEEETTEDTTGASGGTVVHASGGGGSATDYAHIHEVVINRMQPTSFLNIMVKL